ncbi:MAG: alpha/beta fold hydrolase [Proteobacteria bacterium]|nr:alpha/beta fold hydrolase [Pseudomonadota bacterium]
MEKARFILVHGGFIGAWCWRKVTPLIEARGHVVLTPDLPGHGQDRTPPGDITLDAYTDRLTGIIDDIEGPLILVAHSGSGVAVSQAADRRSDRVERLVYVSGLLLRNGQVDLQISSEDRESMLGQSVVLSDDKTCLTLKEETLRDVLMADCSAEDIEFARTRLAPEPLKPALTPMAVSEERFSRIPKTYIECLEDRAITPYLQRKMYRSTSCQKVLSLNSSHSPFFSVPDELAAHLLTSVSLHP